MTTSLIAPVIPSATRVAGRGRNGPGPARRLPLAGPAVRTAAPLEVYGIGRVDASGRVADHAVIGALGWRDGDRLTLTASTDVVVARRDPGGVVTVTSRLCVAIPAALRRRCGLRRRGPGAARRDPGEDTLAAYPMKVVDQAIRAHGRLPPSGR